MLLLIAIIAVPMFLEREPPPLPDNVDVRIPPVEGTKFEPKFPAGADGKKTAEIPAITEPTGAQAAVVAAAPAVTAPAVTPPAAPAKAATVPVAPEKSAAAASKTSAVPEKPVASDPPPKAVAKVQEKAPEKVPEKTATKATPEPAGKPGQLVVQVIAVRDPLVAKQMYDKAKALKFPVYTEKIDVTNGVVTRVRVGPYATRQLAETARGKLAQAGFEAKVLTLQ